MLNVVIPFAHRSHTGKWILVGDDGWFASKGKDGKVLALNNSADVRAHLSEKDIADLCKAHGNHRTGEHGVITLCASPAPGSEVNGTDECTRALVDALREVRAAITAVNRGAGHTVFNPAATQLVDAALALVK